MIKQTKDILMCKIGKKVDIYTEEEINKISELAKETSKEELINIIYKLSELENKMKLSSQKNIIFQTEIIKLCMKNIETQENIAEKDETIKAVSTKKINIPKAIKENVPEIIEKPTERKEVPEKKQTKSQTITPGSPIAGWSNAVNNIKSQGKVMLYANLINTDAVEINDMTVAIRFNNGLNAFRRDLLQKPENMSVLTKEISILCSKPMQVKLEDASGVKVNAVPEKKESKEVTSKEPEDILEDLDIPINFVEE